MTKSCALAVVSALVLAVCLPVPASAQQTEISQKLPPVGIALKMSSLGAGIEIATPVSRHSNARAGFNMFVYAHDFHNDGLAYNARLNLLSLQTIYDWFPFGASFHVSPGLLLYNGNRAAATISTPVGDGSGGNVTATGTAKLEFHRIAPMFLLGWGNLLPRHGPRFSVPFEFGVAYHGQPRASLRMDAITCNSGDAACLAVRTDPDVYNGFQAEQIKLRREVEPFQFYPVVSVGFGYAF